MATLFMAFCVYVFPTNLDSAIEFISPLHYLPEGKTYYVKDITIDANSS